MKKYRFTKNECYYYYSETTTTEVQAEDFDQAARIIDPGAKNAHDLLADLLATDGVGELICLDTGISLGSMEPIEFRLGLGLKYRASYRRLSPTEAAELIEKINIGRAYVFEAIAAVLRLEGSLSAAALVNEANRLAHQHWIEDGANGPEPAACGLALAQKEEGWQPQDAERLEDTISLGWGKSKVRVRIRPDGLVTVKIACPYRGHDRLIEAREWAKNHQAAVA